ncbi:hypothetical protein C1H46_015762 [Malus baccata]|uniref:Late embryogenesis abundant protein LEA-2 subgroup domain-containing protein n=1 Tax=Malus baccata TaxID=106549 RepID=A0A540MID9_MALBA|nr:hypothetical protein C1H46_015762 [Malus baccata]
MSETESPDIKNTGGGVLLFLFVLFAGMFALVMSRRHSESYKVPEFSVDGADLNQFNYTKVNHTISYNLTLNVTLTNPNTIIYFELSDVQVTARYQNNRFGPVTLMNSSTTPFLQGPKNTTIFQNVVVQGHSKTLLFDRQPMNADQIYNIGVEIAFREKFGRMCGEVICNLKLPLMSFNRTSWDRYNTTKCSKV